LTVNVPITAVGAINALGEICGFLPLYSMIMRRASVYSDHDIGRGFGNQDWIRN
jgi:hypothetical protein